MASITNFNQMAAEQQRGIAEQLRLQSIRRTLQYAPANDNRADNATPLGSNLQQACACEPGQGAYPPGFGLS
ncbi:MAG: hypothetical protein J0I12_34595 [Candidatus Eremiobacteraeota bacterium]|nr:hypothetical protein [Candidatus Eremiobacteraeota bacterium]